MTEFGYHTPSVAKPSTATLKQKLAVGRKKPTTSAQFARSGAFLRPLAAADSAIGFKRERRNELQICNWNCCWDVIRGVAVYGLHAQTTPKALAVIAITESDHEGFIKEYAPVVRKVLESKGAKYVSRGGNVVSIEGTEPPTRLTIIEFENIDKAKETFASAEYRDARKIGDKFAKFKILATEEVDR